MNLLADMTSVFRMHGLYPQLAPACKHNVPHMYIAHHYIVNQEDFDNPEKFDQLRQFLQGNKYFKFSVNVKKLLRSTKIFKRLRDPSSMAWFVMQYVAALGEHSLTTLKDKAILTGGEIRR